MKERESPEAPVPMRTQARKMAKQLTRHLRKERPDYDYLRRVFRYVRQELDVEVKRRPKRLPVVPTEVELCRFYEVVWQVRRVQDMVLIKTFLYTGVRVSELIAIRLEEVDLERCQIRINQGKGSKDRIVPFPVPFREVLALQVDRMREKGASHLFESVRRKPYTDRGVRKIIARYAEEAELKHKVSPHKLRHFLLTWLKKQGIDDALIQPYSGHATRRSLEVYSKLAIGEAQEAYDEVIGRFPL